MKKVVVIGGGAGLSTLLRGFKYIDDIDLSVIVTVADDGGSTGTLRDEFKLPAMGDIRRVVSSMSFDREDLENVMEYRFSKDTSTGGHSLGNLIITALAKQKGSFVEGVIALSDILNIKGKVVPVSSEYLILNAEFENGVIVSKERDIPNQKHGNIKRIFYKGKAKANFHALEAIKEADYIVFAVGSLYTSIIANVAVDGIKEALIKNKNARKIYIANVVSQPGETDGYTIDDHVASINRHIGVEYIEEVYYSNTQLDSQLVNKYEKLGQLILKVGNKGNYKLVGLDLIDNDNKELIRHNDKKITKEFTKVFN